MPLVLLIQPFLASAADKCDKLDSELLEAKSHFATLAPETEELRAEKRHMEKELELLRAENSNLSKIKNTLEVNKEAEVKGLWKALLDSNESLEKMEEEKTSLRDQLDKEKEAAAKLEAELRAKIEGAKQDMEKLRQEARSHKTKRHALTEQLNNVRVMHRGSEAEVARLQEEVQFLKERKRGNREVTS